MAWREAIGLALVVLAAAPAEARTYCCKDDNGRRICSDVVPPQCVKRGYQEMNSQGVVARSYDPPPTPEQRAQEAAEAARKKEEARKAALQQRLDDALRASYASAEDIDAKRDRLLAEARSNLKAAEDSYEAALARKQQLASEAEFYAKKPIPAALRNQIRENLSDLESNQNLIEAKRREMAATRERFEDEKRRYLSLTGRALAPPAAERPR